MEEAARGGGVNGDARAHGDDDDDESDDDEIWEDGQQNVDGKQGEVVEVEVEIAGEKGGKRTKKKGQNAQEKRMRAYLLAIAKTRCLEGHKFHLTALVAMALRMEQAANDLDLQAMCLSLIPIDIFPSAACSKAQSIRRFALWFPQFLKPTPEVVTKRPCSIVERCLIAIEERQGTVLDLAVIAAAMLRGAGTICRIVTPLQPVPYKPKGGDAFISKQLKMSSKRAKSVADLDESDVSKMFPSYAMHRLPPFYAWLEVCIDGRWTHVDPFYGVVDEPWPSAVARRLRSSTLDLMAEKVKSDQESPIDLTETALEPIMTPAPQGTTSKKKKDIGEPALVAHVVASWDGRLIDVSRRYSAYWKGVEAARAPRNTYANLLKITTGDSSAIEEMDDEVKEEVQHAEINERVEFESLAADEGVPKTQTALKNHPRYVLEKHILKYEFIHPREPVLGKVGNSCIFPRSNLKLLHTRDRWYRNMRVVSEDATPLKSVNSRSQGQQVKVPLFGEWQTTELVIPPAKNGIVPKTNRNQVELWTEQHLPEGTVHVRRKFSAKVASNLGIDCAPAMLGFEVRGGRSIPIIDGVVVCAEYKELVENGCAEMAKKQAEVIAQKEKEEARKQWRQLFRALRAKQRVKKRYGGLMGADGTYQEMMKASKGNVNTLLDQDDGAKEQQKKKANEALLKGSTQPHDHSFEREFQKDGDQWEKQCTICGLSVTFEKL
eukprot:Plantae.Rhodophyta-Hildenbrandia_rubra.ctg841.p1 GENE.Plantae.Rhodophyta-Hildenbrandia_rubra.ctg841~~Plantae.Rhodophyta-Hildenbrandia_rubra.ctg841.p1  ORF type:complete len:718 (+),score=142.61 Plantae.Rhodophyta-Hildenbrandia_rubra.ctg841:3-2156(+)